MRTASRLEDVASSARRDAARGDAAGLAARLADLAEVIAASGRTAASDAAAIAAVHELPWVRHAALRAVVARHPRRRSTHEAIRWLTHDYDDFVAFEAIRLAGELGVRDALPDLLLIVGSAANRSHGEAGKPVGIGHAVALRAIADLVGTDRSDALAKAEAEAFPDGVDADRYPALDAAPLPSGPHGHEGMVPVPGGRPRSGPPTGLDPALLRFDWDDPEEMDEAAGFWIDVLPTTNGEFDRFAFSDAAATHAHCHPGEPPDKLHLRNTWLDGRQTADMPVTGIDWFDAYAYAAARRVTLPTESEWQLAAIGEDGAAYPWGDDPDVGEVHCFREPAAAGWASVVAWRTALLDRLGEVDGGTTLPVGRPGNVSPFGVRDMSGNVWEWTRSSFDGPPAAPPARAETIDAIYDPRSYTVIKGGCWSSLPEQAHPSFRGRDLLHDRHFEIGFRCSCSCPPTAATAATP